jgi:hypothetical protein
MTIQAFALRALGLAACAALLSGCLAMGVAGAATGAAIGVTGAVVGAGVKGTGKVVGAVIPGGGDKKDAKKKR